MSIQVSRITQANIYLNGSSLLGQIAEFTLPEISQAMQDHDSLGSLGKRQFTSGIEPMKVTFKLNSMFQKAISEAVDPDNIVRLQLRAVRKDEGAVVAETPVIAFLTGQFEKLGGENFQQQQVAMSEFTMNVFAYKLVIDGATIHDIDVNTNKYVINGVDTTENYRQILGQ